MNLKFFGKRAGFERLLCAAAIVALLGSASAADDGASVRLDRYGRLAAFPGKSAVACPAAGDRTAVILAAGQSNIANHAQAQARTAFPDKVFSFYDGQCAVAASPLLGATNVGGEWLTLLGDALIRSGRYDQVVIVPASVGGQPIARFADGDLGDMLDQTASQVSARYRVTHVIWHQGESDFADDTAPEDYRQAFLKILARLRAHGVAAPVLVSVATYCQPMRNWTRDNAIERVQRALPDEKLGVWPGVDSDAFERGPTRFDDCHLSAAGQAKMAQAQAEAIETLARRLKAPLKP